MAQSNPLQTLHTNQIVRRGETFCRLYTGIASDPDSVISEVTRPDDSTTAITPTKNTDGSYTIAYSVPIDAQTGTYTLVTAVISGQYSYTETYSFKVQ